MNLEDTFRNISDYESAPLGGPRVRVLPVGANPKGVRGPVRVRQPEGPTTKELIKENPGTIAAGLATLLTGGSPVALGLLGAAGRAIDKAHPLTSTASDYSTEEPGTSAVDVLLAGITQGVLAKLGPRGKGSRAVEGDEGIRSAIERRPPIRSRIVAPERPEAVIVNTKDKLIDPPLDYRLPPGYKIHNYDYEGYPGLRDIDAKLEAAGLPRFIEAPKGSGFEGFRVGNPERNMHLETPEGVSYARARSTADPTVPIDQRFYSGVTHGEPNPYYAYNPKPGAENHLKWGSDRRAVAESYMQPRVYDPVQWRETVKQMIDEGKVTRDMLPEGITSVEQLRAALSDYHGSNLAAQVLRGTPGMEGLVQDLVPFHRSVKQYDLGGRHWGTRSQIRDLLDAQLEGRDAIQYLNSRDAGPFRFHVEDIQEATRPSNVTVSLDPTRLKSVYNLGTWDLSDPRLLASLIGGLAVGGGTELPDATKRTSPDEHNVRTQK